MLDTPCNVGKVRSENHSFFRRAKSEQALFPGKTRIFFLTLQFCAPNEKKPLSLDRERLHSCRWDLLLSGVAWRLLQE